MKHLAYALLMLLPILACSSDATGPGNNGDDNNTDPIAAETIGSGGGIVAARNITLHVPAGSFASDTTLGIGETSESAYGNNAASKTFMLTGIPANFTAPLTLTVAYTGELVNETFLVIEEPVTDPTTNTTVRVRQFIPVTADGDSVTGTLSSRTTDLTAARATADDMDLLDFYVTVVTDYYSEQQASHIIMHAPYDKRNIVKDLTSHMDQTYNKLADLGFNYTLPGNLYGPIDSIKVFVEDEVFDPPAFPHLYAKEFFGPCIDIEYDYLYASEIDRLKFDTTRALATITAFYYTVTPIRDPTLWFDFAMADWLAREWHDDTAEITSGITSFPLSVFNGIPLFPTGPDNAALEDFINKARRFAPLFSYLHGRYNFTGPEHTLARIYEERYSGADLATSIETVTYLEPTEWWPDFVEAYITGEVWDVDPELFLQSNSSKGKVTISEADTTHTFFGAFGDLAADIYTVTLDAEYADKISTLRFAAESTSLQDEYLTVLVFGVRNGKPYYIGRGLDSIVADAGEASDNDSFLAVVTGSLLEFPYHDDVPYELTVTGAAGIASEFTQIVVQLPYVWRSYEWVDNDGSTSPAGGAGGMFTWTLNEFEKNGDTYHGTSVETMNNDFWGHYTKTSTIDITISGTIASASVVQVTEDFDADATSTQTFEFWGLPLIAPFDIFTVSYGSITEQYLAGEQWPNFTHTYHREENVSPEGYTHETTYYARGANIHLR